jgi:membrane protein
MALPNRLRTTWTIVRETVNDWLADNATRLSAALAFYTILSVAPLLVIVIAIAGWVFGTEAATRHLEEQARGFIGSAGADVLKTTVEHAKRPSEGIIATVIGVATLLFGASGVFGELQGAMNTVWNVKPKPGRGIWSKLRDRFVSFGMVLAVGFLLLVSLVVTSILTAIGGYLSGLVPGLPVLMHVANFLLSIAVVTVLFALIFKFLPDAEISWRDVWFGALVTAGLFTLGKYLIGLYLGHAGVATPFGAAGSLVAFVVWVYYSGLIVFFGAELTKVTARHFGRQIKPTENAMPAKEAEEQKSEPEQRRRSVPQPAMTSGG